jgi:hypothetical protein
MATAATLNETAKAQTPLQVKAGWALSGVAILFLAADAAGKLIAPATMIAYTPAGLGLPTDPGFYRLLGAILAICTLFYAIRRTAVIGAILLTGYLGGAIETHLRADSPLLSNTFFGVYLGLFVWGGLWLRDPHIRALLPIRG